MSGRDCRQELLESDFHIHAEWMLSGTFIAESAICAVDASHIPKPELRVCLAEHVLSGGSYWDLCVKRLSGADLMRGEVVDRLWLRWEADAGVVWRML